MPTDLDAQIDRLARAGLKDLRAEWEERFADDPPDVRSKELLRAFLVWRLQEELFGGPSPEIRRRLRDLGKAFERNPGYSPLPSLGLKPGTVLTREWRGVVHKVRVLKDGFEYDGEEFGSLSEVARRITRTRWSGPVFFGLKRANGNGGEIRK